MNKRLLIDMTKCDACEKCTLECAAFYRGRMTDHGILALRELAAFTLYCRRCENPSCVAACRFDALERQPDGILKRYNLRCVSCKCCSHACPFGTILPDALPFYVTPCDACFERRANGPPCIAGCVNKAIEYREVEPSEKDGVFLLNDRIAVRSQKWNKKDV